MSETIGAYWSQYLTVNKTPILPRFQAQWKVPCAVALFSILDTIRRVALHQKSDIHQVWCNRSLLLSNSKTKKCCREQKIVVSAKKSWKFTEAKEVGYILLTSGVEGSGPRSSCREKPTRTRGAKRIRGNKICSVTLHSSQSVKHRWQLNKLVQLRIY